MKLNFGKTVAAAAAAGLLGVACGGSSPSPETPEAQPEGATTPTDGETAVANTAGGGSGGEGAKACCKGMNECQGKGQCKTANNECAGKNDCKGKGGCNMHCPK